MRWRIVAKSSAARARVRSFRRGQRRGLAVDEVEIILDRWKII